MIAAPASTRTVANELIRPRATLVRPWRVDENETPAAAIGRILLMSMWERLADGEIECVDICLRSGAAILDIIALRLRGPVAEASTNRDTWTHAFALDDVAMVRGVGFGRFRG